MHAKTDTAIAHDHGHVYGRRKRLSGRKLADYASRFYTELLNQAVTALHWAPVAMALGVIAYFALPVEPAAGAGVLAMVAGGAGAWYARVNYSSMFFIGCAVFLAGLGFAAAQYRTASVDAPMLAHETGVVDISGTVVDIDPLPKGYRLVLNKPDIEHIAPDETPENIRVTVRTKGPRPAAGDTVRMIGKLSPPSQPVAPGAFDFRRHAFFQRLGGIGFALGQVEVTAHAPGGTAWLEALRQKISLRLLNSFQTPRTGAVAAALLTGEKRAIAADDIDAMRQSGLAHLLAISGLHIGLVAGFLFFSIRALLAAHEWTALHWPIKKIAAAIAIPCALAYMVLVGAPVPTQRAFFMTGLALLAVILDRTPISMRLVALAACVVLVFSPESLLGASFQLSFAAVTGLVAIYHATSGLWRRWHYNAGPVRRFWLYLFGVALTSLIASCATAPFVLYHFQRMALYGVLANMVAVPVMAFIVMPAGMIALMLMPMGLDAPALYIMGNGIEAILAAAHWVSEMDGAVIHMPAWPSSALLVVALGCVFLALWQGRFRWLGLLPVSAGLVMAISTPQPDLLISADARQMALRLTDGQLAVYDKRGNRFEAENWLERAGEPSAAYFPREGVLEKSSLTCGPLGCIADIGRRRVAFIRDERAVAEDCRHADIILSPVPVRGDCRASLVIDRFDTWRNGAYAVYLNDDQIRAENVREVTGIRPWSKPDPATWRD